MTNFETNQAINKELSRLYLESSDLLINSWKTATQESPPERINEFGIVDEERYDTDNGILFICKETNAWDDEDFRNKLFFRNWMNGITRNGMPEGHHIHKHPQMWYNIGRWIRMIHDPEENVEALSMRREDIIQEIGVIAFTNVNKVRGSAYAGKSFDIVLNHPEPWKVIQKELEILKPKVVVCCGRGIHMLFMRNVVGFSGKLIDMPHPGARKKTQSMLLDLKEQLS